MCGVFVCGVGAVSVCVCVCSTGVSWVMWRGECGKKRFSTTVIFSYFLFVATINLSMFLFSFIKGGSFDIEERLRVHREALIVDVIASDQPKYVVPGI